VHALGLKAGGGIGPLRAAVEAVGVEGSRPGTVDHGLEGAVLAGFQRHAAALEVDLDAPGLGSPDPEPAAIIL